MGAQHPRRVRIIPARAGFTGPGRRFSSGAADHPRSRGVYGPTALGEKVSVGSSPLARGLPDSLRTISRPRGIIPARAGFTSFADGATPTVVGIIPARAGFTRPGSACTITRSDHPRSRGVYGPVPVDINAEEGSSPLARGLRHWSRSPWPGRGIIPARAGFTRTGPGNSSTSQDHPRSRGVYWISTRVVVRSRGSSPLARGLHTKVLWGHRCTGIIPARAGFTRSTAPYVTPRSGSSPLARGLRGSGRHGAGGRRIIPARAGFTLADPWNPNEPVLYQTPAAFTADPGPAPPSCGSAVVVPRWTTTPSGA